MAQANGPTDNDSCAKLTVLISGTGSNLQALIDACNSPTLPNAEIIRVVSDRKDAYGLKRAQDVGISTTYHGIIPYKKKYPSDSKTVPSSDQARIEYDKDLAEIVIADKPDIVVCAGFMRILTTAFLDPLEAAGIAVINLHPSLHGDLIGAHCIERAFEEYKEGKRTKTGVMIHYVIAEVDMGEPILQHEVDIQGCADVDELRGRVQSCEHGLIVAGTKTALERKLGSV